MNIGEAAGACGLPAKAIRYYEDIGPVQPEQRSNGYRAYVEQDVRRLRFVQRARNLGFNIEDCRSLLHLWDQEDRESAEVKGIAMLHLNEVDHKIHELELPRACLRKVITACPLGR